MASKADLEAGTHGRCKRCGKIIRIVRHGKQLHQHLDKQGIRCWRTEYVTA